MNTPVSDILGSHITKRIHAEAGKRLTGRSLSCANNAFRFLIHSDKTAEISETVSYFCVTHAVEESVACVIAAAKENGYHEAKQINPKDHGHKATVAQFAQVISGLAMDIQLRIAISEDTPRLLFRAYPSKPEKEVRGILSLSALRFNEDMDDPDGTAAFVNFTNFFGDEASMVKHIHKRANFRNDALYAQSGGVPTMDRQGLFIQLRENALLSIGLIWAAVDLSYHDKRHPEVLQLLDALVRICRALRPAQART